MHSPRHLNDGLGPQPARARYAALLASLVAIIALAVPALSTEPSIAPILLVPRDPLAMEKPRQEPRPILVEAKPIPLPTDPEEPSPKVSSASVPRASSRASAAEIGSLVGATPRRSTANPQGSSNEPLEVPARATRHSALRRRYFLASRGGRLERRQPPSVQRSADAHFSREFLAAAYVTASGQLGILREVASAPPTAEESGLIKSVPFDPTGKTVAAASPSDLVASSVARVPAKATNMAASRQSRPLAKVIKVRKRSAPQPREPIVQAAEPTLAAESRLQPLDVAAPLAAIATTQKQNRATAPVAELATNDPSKLAEPTLVAESRPQPLDVAAPLAAIATPPKPTRATAPVAELTTNDPTKLAEPTLAQLINGSPTSQPASQQESQLADVIEAHIPISAERERRQPASPTPLLTKAPLPIQPRESRDPVVQFAAENTLAAIDQLEDAEAVPIAQLQETVPEEIQPIEELAPADDGLKPIGSVLARVSPQSGEMPRDYATPKFSREPMIPHSMGTSRDVSESLVFWEAPALCHRPLYFEDINLERHGHKFPLVQPAVSAAHFFGRVPLMPYLMLSEHNCECQYTLGHYRPGDYAPYSLYIPKLRLVPGTVQVGTVAAVLFAFP